jgi:hypothetical protein
VLTGGRAAVAIAAALVLPTLTGLATALLGDRVAVDVSEGTTDESVIARLALLLGVNAAITALCHAVAAAGTWSIVRRAPFAESTLAQPALVFAALRVAGAGLVLASAFAPSLREPLLGPALALLDAAFVTSLLLLTAPALGQGAGRARWVAGGYALARVTSALVVVSSIDALAVASLWHRLLAAGAAAAVVVVLGALAKQLDLPSPTPPSGQVP